MTVASDGCRQKIRGSVADDQFRLLQAEEGSGALSLLTSFYHGMPVGELRDSVL